MFWRYRQVSVENNDTRKYIFDSNYQVARPFIGSGIGARFQFVNTMPSNLQVFSLTVTSGLGGLAPGQIALQPLSDPYHGGIV